MNLVLALCYRHYLVWTRRILVFLGLYILGPTIMLYGLGAAFGIESRLPFILPGIIANSVAAGAFINCSFGGMERLFNKRYDGWLATAMNVPQIILAEGVFQASKAVVVAAGIWLAGVALGAGGNPLPLLGSVPVMLLLAWTCAMLGYCVAASARDFADIELSEPLMTAAFVFSGVFVSISVFAWPLQVFGMLFPIYHSIEVMRPLFMGGVEVGSMLSHLAVLLGMTLASTWAAIRLFQRRLLES